MNIFIVSGIIGIICFVLGIVLGYIKIIERFGFFIWSLYFPFATIFIIYWYMSLNSWGYVGVTKLFCILAFILFALVFSVLVPISFWELINDKDFDFN